MYSQSESVSKINAYASGPDAVPCVKVKWPRATIHWYQTTDLKRGGLRVDGASSAVPEQGFDELQTTSTELQRRSLSGRLFEKLCHSPAETFGSQGS